MRCEGDVKVSAAAVFVTASYSVPEGASTDLM